MTIKSRIGRLLMAAALIAAGGCTLIVENDLKTKYYGIDEQRGEEYLGLIQDKQQEIYKERIAAPQRQEDAGEASL